MEIKQIADAHRGAVNAYLRCLWGGPMMVTRGALYDTSALPGFVAVEDGALLGMALYRLIGDECEVSALLSLVQGMGAGKALLHEVYETARHAGARRLWLVTTNDNTQAIRYYQKNGFKLSAVRLGAFEAVRRLKGELPSRGNDGILIEHEFEFSMDIR